MAMTRKEHAEMDALRQALKLAQALRWPSEPEPERKPLPQTASDTPFHEGWDFNVYNNDVYPAWTEAHVHGTGPYPQSTSNRSASQNGHPLYASRLEAFLALRHAKTREFAKTLAELDTEIEKERSKTP